MKSKTLINSNKSPLQVFILGTGRSGSKTIADILSSIPGCSVVHESEPKLLREVVDYFTGHMSHKEMIDFLRQTRSVKSLGGTLLSGESNQRLSFVLPALAEAFPEARYLWVIRDGRKTVASLYHRDWYHPRESEIRSPQLAGWVSTRLHADHVGDMSEKQWRRLDTFGRCCWYWSYTNRLIHHEAQRLNLKIHICKLEQLYDELPSILPFLNLNVPTPKRIAKSNTTIGLKPMPWQHWSKKQRAIFTELAGQVMDDHYTRWHDEMPLSFGQELAGFIDRHIREIRKATRPIRVNLGLTKLHR